MTRPYKNKVHRAMFDETWDGDGHENSAPRKRFRRNKIDGVVGGVCAGIGDYTGLDPVVVRIAAVILFFASASSVFWVVYLGLWFFTPSDKRAPYRREYREARRAKRKQRKNPTAPIQVTASYRDVKSKYRSLEQRLQDLEKSITSSEWQLRRKFRDLEN